jgi:CheY-like chemotaxis protein
MTQELAIPSWPIQVLLVEDSLDDIELAQRALAGARRSFHLNVVRDGQEALDYLLRQGAYASARHVMPDLVLLDLHLPKVDGLDVLEMIRNTPELTLIPVIIMTASEREEDVVSSYRSGANTYIQKRVEFGEFARSMELLTEYWGSLARLPGRAA